MLRDHFDDVHQRLNRSRSAPSTVSATTIVSSLLTVQTSGARLYRSHRRGREIRAADARAREGAVTLFIRHTSASLTIQENADPSVLDDLTTALDRLAPENAGWTHDTEGPDDMPAHVKTMLTATSLQIPVLNGELALGTWQAIYLIEHRAPSASARDRAAVCRQPTSAESKTGRGAIRGRFVRSPSGGCRRRNAQLVLMSTSLVSGRKKKPTTAVIDAKMIGYQRPA